MEISAETLMAFADGELDAATTARVAAAIRDDARLAGSVAEHRALRERLQAAFAVDLHEPVPQRLVDAARPPPPAVGRSRVGPSGSAIRRQRASRRWWRAPLPLAVAASLAVGIGVGVFLWRGSGALLNRNAQGQLVANGQLARALSHELSGPGSADGVDVVLSFVSRSGEYCRAFRITGSTPRDGVACRRGAQWRVDALARTAGDEGRDSGYRTAGSNLSATTLQAIQSRIVDSPLDRAGEIAARGRDWTPARR